MVPQELEADVPPHAGEVSGNTSRAGSERLGTEMSGAAGGGGGLSPVRERKAKTPMAEMDAAERGLGEAMPLPRGVGNSTVNGNGHGNGVGREPEREEDIVSPNSDTMSSIIGRNRQSLRSSGETGRNSPTVSEGVSSWSPSSPVQRRGSRFEERL